MSIEQKLRIKLALNEKNEILYQDIREMKNTLVCGGSDYDRIAFLLDFIREVVKLSDKEVTLIVSDVNSLFSEQAIERTTSIKDCESTILMLKKMVKEIKKRLCLFSDQEVEDINEYNEKVLNKEIKKKVLKHIIFVISEVSELAKIRDRVFDITLNKLTNNAHRCGIHLVLASAKTRINQPISLAMRTCCPTTICFKTKTIAESRALIGMSGAENLKDKEGEFYYQKGPCAEVIKAITLRQNYLYNKALKLLNTGGLLSKTYMQRRLKISIERANSIVEKLKIQLWGNFTQKNE